jgi:hypothetical protein
MKKIEIKLKYKLKVEKKKIIKIIKSIKSYSTIKHLFD